MDWNYSMIEITVSSFYFLFCLIIGPLLMTKNLKLRQWSFLVVSIFLFSLSIYNLESLFAVTLFLITPYIYLLLVQKKDIPLWPGIILQICLLIYVNKYSWILSFFNIPIPNFITFLGASYIFFRQLDILFQVKSNLVQKVPLVDYLNYLLSFWTILAGPIQRYRDFIKEFYKEIPQVSDTETLKCFHRATNGMFKVILIAPFFLYIKEPSYLLFQAGNSFIFFLIFFYSFPIYLYINFSGYCDVVIGMAKWAGFSIPENFDRPYLSRDMVEFWNRWHITLSQWLRDYLYQPLFKYLLSGPLQKHILISQYISIFITFFFAGLWHGTNINSILFGLFQGIGMSLSMIYRDICKRFLGKKRYKSFYDNKAVMYVERIITLHYVCFTLLVFQYDFTKIFSYLALIIGVN